MSSFSVVIPNYNHGPYLREAVEAVMSQQPVPEQVVLVDDASTDNSREIIEGIVAERGTPLETLFLPENCGVIQASRQGIEKLSSDYLYSLGPDDPAMDGLFARSMAILEENPQAGICFTDCIRLFEDGTEKRVQHRLSDHPRYFSPQQFAEAISKQARFSIATNTCTWNRTALNEAWHPLIENARWHYDWFLSLVLAFRHGVCYIPEALQRVRINQSSYSLMGMKQKQEQEEVVKSLVVLLEMDQFADVRDYFKIPSLLSRFGASLLDILSSNEAYHHYLSDELTSRALKVEEYNRQRDREFSLRSGQEGGDITLDSSRFRCVSPGVYYPVDKTVLVGDGDLTLLAMIGKQLPGRRARICLHESESDAIHEMILSMDQHTYIPPHKQPHKQVSYTPLKGEAELLLFDDDGSVQQIIPLGDVHGHNRFAAVRIPADTYRALRIHSSDFLLHEITSGPFDDAQTQWAPWAPVGPEEGLSFLHNQMITTGVK